MTTSRLVVMNPVTEMPFSQVNAVAGALTLLAGQQANARTLTGAITVRAPAAPVAKQAFAVFDQDGNAAAQPVTINGNGNTIDGAATTSLLSPSGAVVFTFDGEQWRQLLERRTFDGQGLPLELAADTLASNPGAVTAAQLAAVQTAAAADATTKANAAQAASQPVNAANLTPIAALASTAYGRSLLELASLPAAQTAIGVGWITALDLDLSAQASQSLSANGTYTIGGVAGWKRENAAADRVGMALTNGAGLVIKPNGGAYDGVLRTAPLLWLPLSSLFSSVDYSTQFRIWIRATDAYGSGGVFNAGDQFFFGMDSDSLVWAPYTAKVGPLQTARTTRRFTAQTATSTILRGSTPVDQTVAATVNNINRLDTGELGAPGKLAIWWDKTAAAWPVPGASTIRPVNVLTTNYPSTVGTDYPNAVNVNSTVALLSGMGFVFGCANGGASDFFELTISNIRIDYKL